MYNQKDIYCTTQKSFPLTIASVNVTKCADLVIYTKEILEKIVFCKALKGYILPLNNLWVFWILKNRFNCRPPGWHYSLVRMRNSCQKISHKFPRLPLCSILYFDLMAFSENPDKEFQLRPMLFQTCWTGNDITCCKFP